jgi:hypothetical protein
MIAAIPELVEARPTTGYSVWLRFADGVAGEVDLESSLYGEVFMGLRDPSAFRTLRADPEHCTLTWPNGADLAPEYLYQLVVDRGSQL